MQMELTKIKRVLVVEVQDAAKSDDPMIVFLERRGWTEKKIDTVQASISKKLTLDMFTGETAELSGIELAYQADIDRYFLGLATARG